MSSRIAQVVLILSTILASWLGMQMIHELGHIAAAKFVGARIDHIALHPLTISHTDVGPNDHPLVVVWAGPIIGVALPLLIWRLARLAKPAAAFLFRFFAGFCLVANGVYIGVGSFFGIGDCGEMLRNGSPIWTLRLFGGAATVLGFILWNGQGKHFGLGASQQHVTSRSALAVFLLAVLFVTIGLTVGGQ